ncbi:hypothetical protein KBB60_01135 [Patescibacteria group bacterium]|nr:hypothetical protein [Patescibacteria group bacterium]
MSGQDLLGNEARLYARFVASGAMSEEEAWELLRSSARKFGVSEDKARLILENAIVSARAAKH